MFSIKAQNKLQVELLNLIKSLFQVLQDHQTINSLYDQVLLYPKTCKTFLVNSTTVAWRLGCRSAFESALMVKKMLMESALNVIRDFTH